MEYAAARSGSQFGWPIKRVSVSSPTVELSDKPPILANSEYDNVATV
jgi:hypothetical protein